MRSISTVEIPHSMNIYSSAENSNQQNKYFNNHYNQESFNASSFNNYRTEGNNNFSFIPANVNNQLQQPVTATKSTSEETFSYTNNNCDNIDVEKKHSKQKSLTTFSGEKYYNSNTRRCKSTIVAPTLTASNYFANSSYKSLHRFNSMLRKVSCASSSSAFPESLCNFLY